MPHPNIDKFLHELVAELGPDGVKVDPSSLATASSDYAWLSPILGAEVEGLLAEAVALPKTVEELCTVTRLAYTYDIPLTPRGKGTGNYGQSVPLEGGIVIDTSGLNRILEIGEGWMRAEAGVPFSKLEAAAAETGQELSIFPSTTNSFLGGFLSGGSGGTGSVAHGFAWNGFVKSLKVVSCTECSEVFEATGPDTLDYLHGYGTTGLIAEATIKLVPKTPWTALFASFPVEAWVTAAELGYRIMDAETLPRLLSLDQASFLKYYPAHPGMPTDRLSLRIIADPTMLDTYERWITEAGGRVDAIDPKACTLQTFLSYNHVSLRAKQTDPGLCHLQIGGHAAVEKIDEITAILPETSVHLDGMKIAGKPHYGGILVSRFISKERLYEAMDAYKRLGCAIVNPHHWYLGLGHFPTLPDVLRVAKLVDPKGLLNPGRFPPQDVIEENTVSHA
jgi:FAD/FMN-containing dehydrogenase